MFDDYIFDMKDPNYTHFLSGYIRGCLFRVGSVVFQFSPDNIGCMIVLITEKFEQFGPMPFGGNLSGRVFVSLYARSMGHFSKEPIHPNYFKEKLNMTQLEAEAFASLWEIIWGEKEEVKSD